MSDRRTGDILGLRHRKLGDEHDDALCTIINDAGLVNSGLNQRVHSRRRGASVDLPHTDAVALSDPRPTRPTPLAIRSSLGAFPSWRRP